MASSRNLVSTIGAQASPKMGGRNQEFVSTISISVNEGIPLDSYEPVLSFCYDCVKDEK